MDSATGEQTPVLVLLNFVNVIGLGEFLDEMAMLKLKATEFAHVKH